MNDKVGVFHIFKMRDPLVKRGWHSMLSTKIRLKAADYSSKKQVSYQDSYQKLAKISCSLQTTNKYVRGKGKFLFILNAG